MPQPTPLTNPRFLKRSMQMGGSATVYAESEANVWARKGDGQVTRPAEPGVGCWASSRL